MPHRQSDWAPGRLAGTRFVLPITRGKKHALYIRALNSAAEVKVSSGGALVTAELLRLTPHETGVVRLTNFELKSVLIESTSAIVATVTRDSLAAGGPIEEGIDGIHDYFPIVPAAARVSFGMVGACTASWPHSYVFPHPI